MISELISLIHFQSIFSKKLLVCLFLVGQHQPFSFLLDHKWIHIPILKRRLVLLDDFELAFDLFHCLDVQDRRHRRNRGVNSEIESHKDNSDTDGSDIQGSRSESGR